MKIRMLRRGLPDIRTSIPRFSAQNRMVNRPRSPQDLTGLER